MPKILKQGEICSASDFCQLDIVDWGRLNNYFKHDVASLIYGLDTYLAHNAVYTIIEDDLTQYPERSDWPNWRHVGRNHERLGRLYWNMFHYCFDKEGTLHFADAPDFHGTLLRPDGQSSTFFYGDIGRISASAFFIDVFPQFHTGDLWITLKDERHEIIIEIQKDICYAMNEKLVKKFGSL